MRPSITTLLVARPGRERPAGDPDRPRDGHQHRRRLHRRRPGRALFVAEADEAVALDRLSDRGRAPTSTAPPWSRRPGGPAPTPSTRGSGLLAEDAGFAWRCAEAGLLYVGPSPEAIATLGSKLEAKAPGRRGRGAGPRGRGGRGLPAGQAGGGGRGAGLARGGQGLGRRRRAGRCGWWAKATTSSAPSKRSGGRRPPPSGTAPSSSNPGWSRRPPHRGADLRRRRRPARAPLRAGLHRRAPLPAGHHRGPGPEAGAADPGTAGGRGGGRRRGRRLRGRRNRRVPRLRRAALVRRDQQPPRGCAPCHRIDPGPRPGGHAAGGGRGPAAAGRGPPLLAVGSRHRGPPLCRGSRRRLPAAAGPAPPRWRSTPPPAYGWRPAWLSGSRVGDDDPGLATIMALATSRSEAIRRLVTALEGIRIHGPRTNRDQLIAALRHPEFGAGDVDAGFLDRHHATLGVPRGGGEAAPLPRRGRHPGRPDPPSGGVGDLHRPDRGVGRGRLPPGRSGAVTDVAVDGVALPGLRVGAPPPRPSTSRSTGSAAAWPSPGTATSSTATAASATRSSSCGRSATRRSRSR